jgi:hypothetical protein
VVFGRYATVGGVKETWTAPVYILTTDFADALPADEDPMPPDGNPHPLPGNLVPNLNLFVNPQYPEVGWDAVQEPPGNNVNHMGNDAGQHNHPLWDLQDEEQVQQEELPVSMVMNISDSSDSSVNMVLDGVVPVQQNLQVFAMVEMFIGPSPSPEMQRHRWLTAVIPTVQPGLQFKPLGFSPFIF